MKHKNMGQWKIVRRNSKKQQVDGGWRWVDDSDTNHTVELFVDLDDIVAQLGGRATRTKTGKSIYLGGAVIVREVRS